MGATALTGAGAGAATLTSFTATGVSLTTAGAGADTVACLTGALPSTLVSILTVFTREISKLAISFTVCNRPAPKGPPPLCFTSICKDFAINSFSSAFSSTSDVDIFAGTSAGGAGAGIATTLAAGLGGGGACLGGSGLRGTAEPTGAGLTTVAAAATPTTGSGTTTLATGAGLITGAGAGGRVATAFCCC